MASIQEDIAAFEQQQADLEKEHAGKWVLFHNKSLIGFFESFELAANEAVKKFGNGPFLIRQIGAPSLVLPASVMHRLVYG